MLIKISLTLITILLLNGWCYDYQRVYLLKKYSRTPYMYNIYVYELIIGMKKIKAFIQLPIYCLSRKVLMVDTGIQSKDLP